METMHCSFCSQVQRWLKQPFKEDGSVLNWFLFTLLIMIAIWFWSRILARIAP